MLTKHSAQTDGQTRASYDKLDDDKYCIIEQKTDGEEMGGREGKGSAKEKCNEIRIDRWPISCRVHS